MQATPGQALAESIVLRGARQRGAPLQAAQAGDLLDQSLLLEGVQTHEAPLSGRVVHQLAETRLALQIRVLQFVRCASYSDCSGLSDDFNNATREPEAVLMRSFNFSSQFGVAFD